VGAATGGGHRGDRAHGEARSAAHGGPITVSASIRACRCRGVGSEEEIFLEKKRPPLSNLYALIPPPRPNHRLLLICLAAQTARGGPKRRAQPEGPEGGLRMLAAGRAGAGEGPPAMHVGGP
jgi:hypothetical protein